MKSDAQRRHVRTCERCGTSFMGHRATARFCSKSCSSSSRTYAKVSLRERWLQFVPSGLSRGECWPWQGALSKGYGVLQNDEGSRSASRISYELTFGPIPEGLQIDHTCHNIDSTCPGGRSCMHRRCVNPYHLQPVTNAENARRSPQVKRNMRRAQRIRWEGNA